MAGPITPTTPPEDEHIIHAEGYVKLGIQAAVTLILTSAMVWMAIHSIPIPDWLTGAWGLIMGYFFGANGAARVVPAVARLIKKALA